MSAQNGNPPSAPGEDGYHDALLRGHLDAEDAAEAWSQRVSERAHELVDDDPNLTWNGACDLADDQLRREDR